MFVRRELQRLSMTDFFALLGEVRRPWIDAEELKQKFLKRSSEVHPDKFPNPQEKEQASGRYAELNAAYNVLREPKDRILHLLELEMGAKPQDIQRIPPGTMDLFVEVGQVCRDADEFIAEKNKVTSPLLKVQLFEKGMEWTDKLNECQRHVNAKREELEAELKLMNNAWDGAPSEGTARLEYLPLERLEQIYRVFSYITRWTEQIRERIVQLAF